MSTENTEQSEITTTLESTLLQFSAAIKSQQEQNSRVSRRTSHIIGWGVIIMVLLFGAIGFLVWTQKNDVERMGSYMEQMAGDISLMSHAIAKMQGSMGSMERGMGTMERGINRVAGHTESISYAIVQARNENPGAVLSDIADSVRLMQNDVRGLNNSLGKTNYNLNNINKGMKRLNKKLGVMGQDVNRMSSPSRMFPF